MSALCLPSQVTGTSQNDCPSDTEEAGQLTGKGSERGGQPVWCGLRVISGHLDVQGCSVLMPADRSALQHFTWHFKNELGVHL